MLSSLFLDKIHKWNNETIQKSDKLTGSRSAEKNDEKKKTNGDIGKFMIISTEVFQREENANIIECF